MVAVVVCGRGRWGMSAVAAALVLGCGRGENEYVPPPAVEVSVMQPLRRAVTDYLEESGETEAVERADVRSRVQGFIEGIEFEPGQWVERETLLYRIERAEYAANVKSATAEVAAAEAGIAVAEAEVVTAQSEVSRSERDLRRQQSLLDQQATSQSEFDQALALAEGAKATLTAAQSAVEAAKARLQQAQARLNRAQLDLDYTEVMAPIAGRVTATGVKLGNLVDSGSELAAVVNDKRIYANFSISDRQLLRFRAARGGDVPRRMTQEQWSRVPVYLRRELDSDYLFEGRIDYIDQEGIDTTTGTLSVRAVFENPEGGLFPGLFVQVRIPISTREDTLLVPAQSLLRDRVGSFLLVLGEGNRVERRDVRTGQGIGAWLVVDQGLRSDERVIVDGVQRARPGAVVQPMEHSFDPATLPAALQVTSASDQVDTE